MSSAPKQRKTSPLSGSIAYVLIAICIFALAKLILEPVRSHDDHSQMTRLSYMKRLGNAQLVYAMNHNDRLPFPGGPQGGPLAGPGSPAWVIAGVKGSGGINPIAIDYLHMARPEGGSLAPYVKDHSVYRVSWPQREVTHEGPDHVVVRPETFKVSFTMSDCLAPILHPDGSIETVSATEFASPEKVALHILESPATMSGGAFLTQKSEHGFPMSKFAVDPNNQGVMLGYLDGHVKKIHSQKLEAPGTMYGAFPPRNARGKE